MNKQEAIEQMKKGIKITHEWFSKDEWVTMNSRGEIVLEDGFICSPNEFWQWRTSGTWNNGYSLFETNN